MSLNDAAKALYDACPTVKPTWEQLGDVTRSVWIERVIGECPASPNVTFDLSSLLPQPAHQGDPSMSTPDRFNIVQFQAATGLPLTADFLSTTLGVKPDETLTVKRAVFWRPPQYKDILSALAKHIASKAGNDPCAFSGERPKGKAEEKKTDAAGAAGAADFSFDAGGSTTEQTGDGFNFGEPETKPAGDFDFSTGEAAEPAGFTF